MSPISFSYTADQLKQLASIIERTTPSTTVDRDGFNERLLDLMQAVGRMNDGTEWSIGFRESVALQPSHAELAKRFRAIAASKDPLNPKLCSEIVLTELNQAARVKWARRLRKRLINRPHPIRGVPSEFLTEEELSDVRQMALHLARYHQSFVRRQRPDKIDQNTLLHSLADIYLEFAKLSCDRYCLPHALNSRFVRFVHLAMRPFFDLTEASLKSISHRWKRLKDASNQGAT